MQRAADWAVPDLSGRGRAQSDLIGCRQRPPASVEWAAIENPNLSGERPPPARIYVAHNLSHRIYWAQTALALGDETSEEEDLSEASVTYTEDGFVNTREEDMDAARALCETASEAADEGGDENH